MSKHSSMKQYKLQTGGNRNIFDILTVHDDGRMTITFHGTDRVITHEAKEQTDGRILSGTSLFPPLSSGKWFETTFTQEPAAPKADTTATPKAAAPKVAVATTPKAAAPKEHVTSCTTPKAAAPKVAIAATTKTATPKVAVATTKDVYGRLYGSHYDHREKSENKDQKVLLISSIVAAAVFIALVSTVGVFGLATVGILAGSMLKGA
jgi:hypothetical protein